MAILGGTGFVGRNLRDELESAGMGVGVFSRTTGCDLLDLQEAWKALDDFRPDYLVNCAALVGSVNFVADFAADVVDVNMRIILNVYKIAQKMQEAIVVNPIANCAYPGRLTRFEEGGFWEGPIHDSVLSYGSTRRMMHVLARCYKDQYGVRSLNLIVPNLYGPHDSLNPNKTHALNALIIKFVRAQKEGHGSVEVWGTGEPIREWLFVGDLTAVIRRALESGDYFVEPLNIGQDRGHTVRELVELVRATTGYAGGVQYNTAYPDGSPQRIMDGKRFRQRFPDFSFMPIEHGIRETVEHYRRII